MYPILEVTDRDGWRKEFPLEQALVFIGSGPKAQIVLPPSRGNGVDPLHVQLMLSPGQCKLVNMSKSVLEIIDGGEAVLIEPRKLRPIGMDSQFKVGDFQLRLSGAPASAAHAFSNGNGYREPAVFTPVLTPVMVGSTADKVAPRVVPAPRLAPPPVYGPGPVGLAVRLTQPALTSEQAAEAVVTISNRGDKTAVQFRLQVDGLPPECFEVPPLPLLFPGAEKTFVMTFTHPSTVLRSGPHLLRFIAVAPEAYPGEQAAVQQTLTVPALYRHEMTIRGPL